MKSKGIEKFQKRNYHAIIVSNKLSNIKLLEWYMIKKSVSNIYLVLFKKVLIPNDPYHLRELFSQSFFFQQNDIVTHVRMR